MAIITAEAELKHLYTLIQRWESGSLSNADMANLVARKSTQLQKACWCEESVCCQAHNVHVVPHKNCMLR